MSLRVLLQGLALAFTLLVLTPALADERSASWASLTPAQQQALAPLQREWASIEPNRRQKWLEVAARFPRMPPDERARLQARMTEWARMTPAERATARQQFQEARRVSDEERRARWQAYQSLTPEERDRLARSAKPAARQRSDEARAEGRARAEAADANGNGAANGSGDDASAKRNIVRTPAQVPARVVNPGVKQAGPGATTTPLTTRAAPPLHHQNGLPKIAATPNFVDPQTLLPQKGPQGAAVRSAPASEPRKP